MRGITSCLVRRALLPGMRLGAGVVAAALMACGSTEPKMDPVGHYALIGCTYPGFGITTPTGCGFTTGGGSTTWDTTASYLELRDDGSATRVVKSGFRFSPAIPAPGGGPDTTTYLGTFTATGSWSVSSGTVTVTWTNWKTPSTLERGGDGALGDNGIYTDYVYFWFARR